MTRYFADPGCPYQRGTNENSIGLIRQYFPQGTDFRNVAHQEVRRVEILLNNRPGACLSFQTPHERLLRKTTAYPLRLRLETAVSWFLPGDRQF